MATAIEVADVPPLVEIQRASQSDTVVERYINDLPISRRDYLTFTLLMPGVSNSSTIADNADFRVKQTPQSGLSFYGSNGRGNSVTVDGGEANDDAGGVRLTLSQDAVQEFQINRSNYPAELGGPAPLPSTLSPSLAPPPCTAGCSASSATMAWTPAIRLRLARR